MKAVRVNEWGKPVQLEDVPQPKLANDEALVRVHAASINPADAAVVAGYFSFMATPPLTLGADFSGEVVEVGKDVTHVKPGDAVFGVIPVRSGTFSEYATPKAHEVALKPKSLDHIHASTIGLPAMAAWLSLFEHGQYKDGERVLIQGVGGAVGGLAAQLAKNRGAYVYGTDIPEKAGHAAGLGIDRFIDVTSERFEDVVENVDIVLDYVGGEIMERSYKVLKSGGRYVTTMLLETPQEEPGKRGFRSTGMGAYPRADLLAQTADMIDAGKLKIFVNRTFPLEEAQAALEYRFLTKAPGKVVLTVL
jgi:NADPH:quinone reductase-like Zn-dependent oxidoreductase